LPFSLRIQWSRAATLSAILQLVASIAAIGEWYLYKMTSVVNAGIESATGGSLQGKVSDHQIAAAALIIFVMSPFTWVLSYFLLEGAVRLFAAVSTEDALGTLPLYLLGRVLFPPANRNHLQHREAGQSNVKSFVGSIRERVVVAKLAQVPDELRYSCSDSEEFLEIWASRKNPDWVAPAVMRVDEIYYRLEETSFEKGTRPFRYRLRRLSKGVPGRKVLIYKTVDALVKA